MGINVVALDRGGFAAYGGADYDERDRVIRLNVFEDEVIDTVIQFSTAPDEVDYEEDGIEISAPVISGNTIVFQFQQLHPSGTLEVLAMFDSGAAKKIRFQANAAQPFDDAALAPTDDDDVDYGEWG